MITICEAVCRELKRLGEAVYPDEACGILIGTRAEDTGEKSVSRFLAVPNTAGEKFHRFAIEPEQMIGAEKSAASSGEEVIGIFHTHPDVAAVPSEYDRSHALPVYSYVIGSVRHGKMTELRSWELSLSDFRFREEKLESHADA